jgi:hypothetical protein
MDVNAELEPQPLFQRPEKSQFGHEKPMREGVLRAYNSGVCVKNLANSQWKDAFDHLTDGFPHMPRDRLWFSLSGIGAAWMLENQRRFCDNRSFDVPLMRHATSE